MQTLKEARAGPNTVYEHTICTTRN